MLKKILLLNINLHFLLSGAYVAFKECERDSMIIDLIQIKHA